MIVEKFDVTDHYAQIASWYTYRRQVPPPVSLLPRVGFIISDVACCFLYQTDSHLAFMEGAIANPLADKERRNEALDMIGVTICEEAKRLGFKHIFGVSKIEAVQKRVKRHGGVTDGVPHLVIKRAL